MSLVFLEKWIFQILLVSFSVTCDTMRGNTVLPALTDFENGDCCSGGFDFDNLAEMAAEEAFKKSNSSSFSWFRRVLKFALPVQFFVMMMLFLAWVRYFLCFS